MPIHSHTVLMRISGSLNSHPPVPRALMHMREKGPPSDPGDPSRETREVWDRNADFWDGRMGEGNEFHSLLVAPSQERLLGLGELIKGVLGFAGRGGEGAGRRPPRARQSLLFHVAGRT